MPALEQSIENETRHAIFVNRFAGGLHREFTPFLNELKKEISFKLNNDPTPTSQRKLNALIRQVASIQRDIYTQYTDDLNGQLDMFIEMEADFEVDNLSDVIEDDIVLKTPSPEQLIVAARSNPLVFPDSNNTVLLKPFIDNWTKSEINRVSSIIRTGYAMGETNQQIAQRIAGKGGTLSKKTKTNNAAIVRTSVNHLSTQAKQMVFDKNDDIVIGYEWVSTLDGRTSDQCKSLSGEIFLNKKRGFKPKPPIHVNCRSTTSPVLSSEYDLDESKGDINSTGSSGKKKVSANTTYYSFLKKQSKAFQDETLGTTKAKLFRDGGMTADQFAKLTVDEKYRPLTLDELKRKAPKVFDKAGV